MRSNLICLLFNLNSHYSKNQSILEIPLLWRGGEAGVVDAMPIQSIGWRLPLKTTNLISKFRLKPLRFTISHTTG
jgi:hypothetical protein